ncbi:hypothetical protein D3C81_2224370 [compost metagenome]
MQTLFDFQREVADRRQRRIRGPPQPAQIIFAKARFRLQAEARRQLRVIAELRMHIQRQVIGK